ncbi:MAG: 50S ribosomal protein L15 [Candidatus Goldbacteria bacterium]|nr:50S ribosomal protein L15 [Candidatus Goldiibacteriota bacterium]
MFEDLKINKKKRKKRTRVGRGRGSGLGKTAGRGNKGQNSRSGAGKPPWFEGGQQTYVRRIPKTGFKNPFKEDVQIINIGFLNEKFENGSIIDKNILFEKGYIKDKEKKLKILGDGNISKSFTIKADKFSKNAIDKIKQAGGKVEVI